MTTRRFVARQPRPRRQRQHWHVVWWPPAHLGTEPHLECLWWVNTEREARRYVERYGGRPGWTVGVRWGAMPGRPEWSRHHACQRWMLS